MLQAPNENTTICCTLVGLCKCGIWRQDPMAYRCDMGMRRELRERVLQHSLPLATGPGQAPDNLVKATTTSVCLNDSQQPVDLEDCWSHPERQQESRYSRMAHILPLGSSGSPRIGKSRFLSRKCWHCSGKQQHQLMKLVLLLNGLVPVTKCLLTRA